jgi:hypothetical protein
MMIAQISNMVLNIILATLVVTGYIQPWHVYLSGFLTGVAQSFQQVRLRLVQY